MCHQGRRVPARTTAACCMGSRPVWPSGRCDLTVVYRAGGWLQARNRVRRSRLPPAICTRAQRRSDATDLIMNSRPADYARDVGMDQFDLRRQPACTLIYPGAAGLATFSAPGPGVQTRRASVALGLDRRRLPTISQAPQVIPPPDAARMKPPLPIGLARFGGNRLARRSRPACRMRYRGYTAV